MQILNISLEKKLFESDSPVQRRVLEYGNLFKRYDLVVMTKSGYQSLEFKNMLIYPTNSISKLFYIFDAWRLGKKIIKERKSDIISVQDPFEMGIAGWLLARKFKLKFQVQLHGDFFSSSFWRQEKFLNYFRYWLGKFIVKKADAVRAVSQRIKNSLLKIGVSEKKISVVPIYIETGIMNYESRIKDGNNFVFLTVGRLVEVKNIGMQIEAMGEIIKKFPEAELWIVGDGPERKNLKIKSEKLKVADKIKFFGWQDNLRDFYSQADVFLLTSNYEGWGMAVVEAASAGLPIIMTDVGCAGEVIKNNEGGIVIAVGNKKMLIESMIELINDRDLASRLGRNAQDAVEKLPGKEENLKMYKEACEKAMLN